MKKTAKLVDNSEAVDSSSDVVVSFEFGLSRVTLSDLGEFMKAGWFAHDLARLSEGELFLTLVMMRLLFIRSS